jgi:two-component system sensor histidine kinase TctE
MTETARPRQLSLRRQLLIWLLLPQLVLWLAAAMLAHAMAVRYTNEVIDQTLAQTSRALARQVKPFGNGFYVDFPVPHGKSWKKTPATGCITWSARRLPPSWANRPCRATGNLVAKAGNSYFYNASMKGQDVRVAALYLQAGTPNNRS